MVDAESGAILGVTIVGQEDWRNNVGAADGHDGWHYLASAKDTIFCTSAVTESINVVYSPDEVYNTHSKQFSYKIGTVAQPKTLQI